MHRTKLTALSAMVMACFISLAAIVSTAQAGTIAHWRFESGANFLEDSGPNGLDLTANGSPTPSYSALPTSGPGSEFPNPVPQTGEANNGIAEFSAAGGWLSHSDDPVLSTLGDLTIEVFFNRDTLDKMWFVGQYNSGIGQRGWGFGVRDDGANNKPFLYYCSSGSSATSENAVGDNMCCYADHDYYLAVTLDVSDTESGLTYYLQDLTGNSTYPGLQISSGGHGFTTLHDSSALLAIGTVNDGGGYLFDGVIDEIRISNCVLPQSQLLISVPEPGMMVLWGTLLLGLLCRFRRGR